MGWGNVGALSAGLRNPRMKGNERKGWIPISKDSFGHSASNTSWEIDADVHEGISHAPQDSTENIHTQQLNSAHLAAGSYFKCNLNVLS